MHDDSQQSQPQIISFNNKKQPEAPNTTLVYPWYQQHTMNIVDPILRMHNQAVEFYLYVTPGHEKGLHQKNVNGFEIVKNIALNANKDTIVLSPFFENQIYLRGGQIEMYILVEDLQRQHFTKLTQSLHLSFPNSTFNEFQSTQKYPLFQFQFLPSSSSPTFPNTSFILRMVQHSNWYQYLNFISQSLTNILQLKYLYMIFSCMIRQRWMHLSIRPVLLFGLLSVFYHERRKQKHRTLSQNIIKFVEYYGVGPFQERRINYMGKGRYQLLQEGYGPNQTSFSFWINPRISISSPQLKQFFNVMRNRYRLISNYNFDEKQSIIGYLVNPCGKEFEYL